MFDEPKPYKPASPSIDSFIIDKPHTLQTSQFLFKNFCSTTPYYPFYPSVYETHSVDSILDSL